MRQEIFCRMIFVTEVLLWTVIFYPFCVEGGNCDYLKLWLLVGINKGKQTSIHNIGRAKVITTVTSGYVVCRRREL